MFQYKIPFNKPHLSGKELKYIKHANSLGMLAGDGFYTKKCSNFLEEKLKTIRVFLTHSGTAALEMAAILCDLKKDDEVIMPSFTFTSTANAFVLRGAVPVFIDIRKDTLNINENYIEEAITENTKAIVVVHYAGVSCEMKKIINIAKKYNLVLIEDAAQGFLSKYCQKYLGTLGEIGIISFHETKNIISGEGGVLLINEEEYIERAEIIREKGTNRSQFFMGQVDKYTWVDIGSSYLPSEITAAFLYAQLEKAEEITKKRKLLWDRYHIGLKDLEEKGLIHRPIIPKECEHNGHIYYILLNSIKERNELINFLKKKGILAVFHYIPLHSSPAGKKYCKFFGDMRITNQTSDCLLRLPMFFNLSKANQDFIINSIYNFLTNT